MSAENRPDCDACRQYVAVTGALLKEAYALLRSAAQGQDVSGEATEWCLRAAASVERREYVNGIEKNAVLKAIADEPEAPGPMPDEMWMAVSTARETCEEALRIAIRLTKRNIAERVERLFISGETE